MLGMLFIVFVVLLLLGAPIAVSLGVSTLSVSQIYETISTASFTKVGTGSFSSYLLVACPLFTFAGDIMAKGGISRRLIDVSKIFFGNIHGGIGIVAVIASMIFAAISGTGSATVAAIGLIMIPEMVENGYQRSYGTSLVACAGTIGTMIPPSVCMVIYSVTAGVSITSMFTAGIPAGIIMGLALCLYCYFSSRKRGYKPAVKQTFTAKEVVHTCVDAIPAFAVPVIILGGIYSGLVTPTESAALGCVVGIIVSVFIYKETSIKLIPHLAVRAMTIAAPVMFIIGMSKGFGSVLSIANVPTMVANAFLSITESRIALLLLINILYLCMGTFMETNAAIILMTPILLPVVTAVGVSPVQFGIITIVNLAIGFVTPPLGANLFMASAIGKVKLNELTKVVWPWIGVMVATLLLITYWPDLTLFLPKMLGYSI